MYVPWHALTVRRQWRHQIMVAPVFKAITGRRQDVGGRLQKRRRRGAEGERHTYIQNMAAFAAQNRQLEAS